MRLTVLHPKSPAFNMPSTRPLKFYFDGQALAVGRTSEGSYFVTTVTKSNKQVTPQIVVGIPSDVSTKENTPNEEVLQHIKQAQEDFAALENMSGKELKAAWEKLLHKYFNTGKNIKEFVEKELAVFASHGGNQLIPNRI